MYLQCGHRLRRWKRQPQAGHRRPACLASMWPSPFGGGNRIPPFSIAIIIPGSMGPPPFGDGKLSYIQDVGLRYARLQWGHRLSAMERRSTGSEGGTSCQPLQWGHRLSAMERGARPRRFSNSRLRFNGATAFRRWKAPDASRSSAFRSRFNGATAFRRWKGVSDQMRVN